MEVMNSTPPEKDRSHLLMKKLNKDNRKIRQTRLNNEIQNMSQEGFYIVQNSVDGEDNHSEGITKVSTLTENPLVMKSLKNKTLIPSANLNQSLIPKGTSVEESMNFKKIISNKKIANTFINKNNIISTTNQSIEKDKTINSHTPLSKQSSLAQKQSEGENRETTLNHQNTEDKLILNVNKSKASNSIQSTPRNASVKNEIVESSYNNKNVDINNNIEGINDPYANDFEKKNEEEEDVNNKQNINYNNENIGERAERNSGKIDVQNILIESLRNGEYVYYCLNMLASINDSVLNIKHTE